MSKLIKLIEAHQYPNSAQALPRERLFAMAEEITEVSFGVGYEYRIDVRLGASRLVGKPEEVERMKELVRRQLCEFVFGEFRPMIIEIEEATWRQDAAATRAALNKLASAMLDC